MRVLLDTFGTEGDVRPFVALGATLQSRGHEVLVCSADGFGDLVRGSGVPFAGFGDAWYDAMRAAMDDPLGGVGWLRHLPRVLSGMQSSLDRQWKVARRFAPDVVVFHPKPLAAPHIAERLGVPAVLALAVPVYHATRAHPPAMLPGLPRALWPLGHRLAASASAPYRGMLDRFRGRIGLPHLPRGRDEVTNPDGSPRQVLSAWSPAVLPVPPDYPPSAHVTGYWFTEDAGEEAAPTLSDFVGRAPVDLYLGFGSMASGRQRDRLSDAVAEALARTGLRAVVATGWGGLDGSRLPANALAVDRVSHAWLFDRVGAVVHHGGAGTVAAGLRAGRPTLICPLMADQPFWGRRVHELGAGPPPVPLRRLTPDALVRTLDRLVSDDGYRRRAGELGEAIARERGTTRAAELIESVAGRNATAGPSPRP